MKNHSGDKFLPAHPGAQPTDCDLAGAVVRHDPARKRFEIEHEGLTAFLEYSDQDGTVVLEHTFVPPSIRGRGVAAVLTRFAIEKAREENLKVDPQCSSTDAYFRRHPEFASVRIA